MLVEKYPIPKDDDAKEDQQIEGFNFGMTQSFKSSGNHNNNNNNNEAKYDKKYICPITKKLMKCPVIAYDGCVYEKEAIVEYLRLNHTTPNQTNRKLANKEEGEQMIQMLFEHFALKTEIQSLT